MSTVPAPNDRIADLFLKIVRRDPGHLAVQDADGSLSYAELDLAANQIAAAIRARTGTKPTRVCVLGRQDRFAIAGILGVLKAGQCFVPLPAGYPVSGKQVGMVDADGHAVAPGDEGEITVTGLYLSPGYWNQPEGTARSFQRLANGAGVYATGAPGPCGKYAAHRQR